MTSPARLRSSCGAPLRPGERDSGQGCSPTVAVPVMPPDLVGAGFVVDDREGVVSQRQIRDKLRGAKGERRGDDEVGQPDLRGAAERRTDSRPERAGINVD